MDELDKKLSKTVYSVGRKRAIDIIKKVMVDDDNSLVSSKAYTKWQDGENDPFFKSFENWCGERIDFKDFGFKYPTSGSSEAIKSQLTYLNSIGKTLLVLDGEYEGYLMMAKAIGMPFKIMRRSDYRDYKYDRKNDVIFISQPSSIDGEIWGEFHEFACFCSSINVDLYVDVTYLGATTKDFKINLKKYKSVKGLFFSLSKTFGVYYHRIGGVYLKEENPVLFPNIWFKNLLSMRIGSALMDGYPINDLINDNKNKQWAVISKIYGLGVTVHPADVYMLGNISDNDIGKLGSEKDWKRVPGDKTRVCMSAFISED